jgi:hypothetical protein
MGVRRIRGDFLRFHQTLLRPFPVVEDVWAIRKKMGLVKSLTGAGTNDGQCTREMETSTFVIAWLSEFGRF